MDIIGRIESISYCPTMCRDLQIYPAESVVNAFESRDASFFLDFNRRGMIAISRWVSSKRTRSYPYARVYNTLSFTGKKVTVIPIMKDEGKDGDRDYLQWDTICLMSLLGVYVIIEYYCHAERSKKYRNKITHQQFDYDHLNLQFNNLLDYHSDALHWNIEQTEPSKLELICNKSFEYYDKISADLGVEMHNRDSANRKFLKIYKSRSEFMNQSRFLAQAAQHREVITIQPKESISGKKASITIHNYLGGAYYLTIDECEIDKNNLILVEAKHTKNGKIPSESDIKDALVKMALFTNLSHVTVDKKPYRVVPVIKLTTIGGLKPESFTGSAKQVFEKLLIEAKANRFEIRTI